MTELNQEEREDPMARVIFYEIKKKNRHNIRQKNHQKNLSKDSSKRFVKKFVKKFVIIFVKKIRQKKIVKKFFNNKYVTPSNSNTE